MKISIRMLCLSLCLLLATSGAIRAQEKNPQEMEKSCHAFVQGFYSWYFRHGDEGRALKRYAFSPELGRLLRKDEKAGAIDFDRFLATNGDAFERYVVGKATLKGNTCWVEVYGIASRKRSEKPVVIPEVMYKDGRWLFANFHYSWNKGGDLLSMLRNDFREERRKHSK